MKMQRQALALMLLMVLAACTTTATTLQSRDQLWAQYAHQPIDNLLMALGTPTRESHLSDGSRLVTYQFNSVFDSGSPYERQTGCEATFLAKAPKFRLEDIAMQGQPFECSMLAKGHTGTARHPYLPPQTPYMGYPYMGGRVPSLYRYGF
jgi:hypothetical protein